MIATPQMALEAAARGRAQSGVSLLILGDSIEGEARDVGKVRPASPGRSRCAASRSRAPSVLLSGGETTVTVRGKGRGGRNVEYLLSLGHRARRPAGIHALAADTDGVDGQEEIAGAYLTPDSLQRAWAMGIRPKDSLADNDGHGFFEVLGDRWSPGRRSPTSTTFAPS